MSATAKAPALPSPELLTYAAELLTREAVRIGNTAEREPNYAATIRDRLNDAHNLMIAADWLTQLAIGLSTTTPDDDSLFAACDVLDRRTLDATQPEGEKDVCVTVGLFVHSTRNVVEARIMRARRRLRSLMRKTAAAE